MLELTDPRIAPEDDERPRRHHARTGCLHDAIACYERGLAGMRQCGDRRGEARTLASVAGVYLQDGRREDAIDCCESCLVILRENRDRGGESQALRELHVAMRGFDGARDRI